MGSSDSISFGLLHSVMNNIVGGNLTSTSHDGLLPPSALRLGFELSLAELG